MGSEMCIRDRVSSVVYVRVTKDVGLMEVSEKYMRASVRADFLGNVYTVLGILTDYLSPIELCIRGTTRSGGFEECFKCTTNVVAWGDELERWFGYLHFACERGKLLLMIADVVMRNRQIGYLYADGVVRHISEPVQKVYLTIKSLRRAYSNTQIEVRSKLLKDISIAAYSDNIQRLYDLVMNPPKNIMPHAIVSEVEYENISEVQKRDLEQYCLEQMEEDVYVIRVHSRLCGIPKMLAGIPVNEASHARIIAKLSQSLMEALRKELFIIYRVPCNIVCRKPHPKALKYECLEIKTTIRENILEIIKEW